MDPISIRSQSRGINFKIVKIKGKKGYISLKRVIGIFEGKQAGCIHPRDHLLRRRIDVRGGSSISIPFPPSSSMLMAEEKEEKEGEIMH